MTTPKRDLSCFFVRELFALYFEDRLDIERKLQVDAHLAGCNECSSLFEREKRVQALLSELSHTVPIPSLVEYIKKEESFWSEIFQTVGWRRWPASLKWATELLMVALVLITTIHYFPWIRVAKKLESMRPIAAPLETVAQNNNSGATNVTANTNPETKNTNTDDEESEPAKPLNKPGVKPAPVVATANTSQDDDESAAPPVAPTAAAQVQAQVQPTAMPSPQIASSPVLAEAKLPGPTPKAEASGKTDVAQGDEPDEETQNENKSLNADAPAAGAAEGGDSKRVGYVWRGTLKVDALSDEVTSRVTQAITDLGGVKAGQVELGWHRGNQRYYHFIFPEDNYERLLSLLNNEGLAELKRERHPRVIKQGHMRIIMTLEEDK